METKQQRSALLEELDNLANEPNLKPSQRETVAAAFNAVQQRDELAAALRLTLAELEAYELPKDSLHPQVVAVEAARAALAKVRATEE